MASKAHAGLLAFAENCIEARGATQDEAWHNAVLQAEAVGMAGQFRGAQSRCG
jgi:hypothetical protein